MTKNQALEILFGGLFIIGGTFLLFEGVTTLFDQGACIPVEKSIEDGTYVADLYDGVLCKGDI